MLSFMRFVRATHVAKRPRLSWVRAGLISVQVLNEFAAVARRKLNKSWEEIRRALGILRVFCPEPAPLTVKTHEAAFEIAERYKYSIYDGLIIAAAIETGSKVLYSEDLKDGQVIENILTIRNPFKS